MQNIDTYKIRLESSNELMKLNLATISYYLNYDVENCEIKNQYEFLNKIDPYGYTLFWEFQYKKLIEELKLFSTEKIDENDKVEILEFVNELEKYDYNYLIFIGD